MPQHQQQLSDEELAQKYGAGSGTVSDDDLAKKYGVPQNQAPAEESDAEKKLRQSVKFNPFYSGPGAAGPLEKLVHGAESAGQGVVELGKGMYGMGKDLVTPVTTSRTEMFHPFTEHFPAVFNKYISQPREEELKKAGEETSPSAGFGHAFAANVPLVGPWAANFAERAPFDPYGEVPKFGAQIAATELAPKMVSRAAGKAVDAFSPATEADTLAKAHEQLMGASNLRKGDVGYRDTAHEATQADMRQVAADNPNVKTPREAAGAITKHVDSLEQPVKDLLKVYNKETINPFDQHQVGGLTPEEIQAGKAKTTIVDSVRDSIQSHHFTDTEARAAVKNISYLLRQAGDAAGNIRLGDAWDLRERLNNELDDFYEAKSRGNPTDLSAADTVAKKAARDYLAKELYSKIDDLNRANNRPGTVGDIMNRVGNLLEIRDKMVENSVRAEKMGTKFDWSKSLTGGLGFASLPVLLGQAFGAGPLGAGIGLSMEALKVLRDLKNFKAKNPNALVSGAFENLRKAGPTNLPEFPKVSSTDLANAEATATPSPRSLRQGAAIGRVPRLQPPAQGEIPFGPRTLFDLEQTGTPPEPFPPPGAIVKFPGTPPTTTMPPSGSPFNMPGPGANDLFKLPDAGRLNLLEKPGPLARRTGPAVTHMVERPSPFQAAEKPVTFENAGPAGITYTTDPNGTTWAKSPDSPAAVSIPKGMSGMEAEKYAKEKLDLQKKFSSRNREELASKQSSNAEQVQALRVENQRLDMDLRSGKGSQAERDAATARMKQNDAMIESLSKKK